MLIVCVERLSQTHLPRLNGDSQCSVPTDVFLSNMIVIDFILLYSGSSFIMTIVFSCKYYYFNNTDACIYFN